MSRPRRIAPVLPAALVAVLALLLPLLGSSEGGVAVSVSAGSVTAKAAQHDEAPADARFPVDGPLFAEAKRIATAHWGTDACKGQVAVAWQTLEPGTNATATWRNPTDAWNNAAENFDCSVTLNTKAEFDFAKLCTVLTHEVGHLVGRQHAAAEGELMSAMYSSPLPTCAQAAPQKEPADDLEAADEGADEAQAAAAAKPGKSTRKTSSKSSKRSLRKPRSKRCVRRFSDGRRTSRCARVATQAKRAHRAKRS